MLKGTPKASAVATFRNQIEALVKQNELNSKAILITGSGSVWESGDFKGDIQNPTEVKKAFNRSDIINILNEVMAPDNPGTAADKIALKFQSDYLAAMERAFLLRHAGSVRSEMFSAGRRKFSAQANMRSSTYDNLKAILERGN